MEPTYTPTPMPHNVRSLIQTLKLGDRKVNWITRLKRICASRDLTLDCQGGIITVKVDGWVVYFTEVGVSGINAYRATASKE